MGRAVAAAAKNANRSQPKKQQDVAGGREAQREITRALHSQARVNSFIIDVGGNGGEENVEAGNGVTLKSPQRRSIWSQLTHPHKDSLNAKEREALQKSLEERGEYTQREINALKKVQYRIRCRRQKTRLYKKLLIERLEYERSFTFGFLGLFNQTAIFFLLTAALYLGGKQDGQRGIYFALDEAFDFDAIKAVSSRDEFVTEMMPHVSKMSKKHFVLSSQYWDTKDKGSIEILKPVTYFTGPKLLSGVQVNLNLPSFSWSCWVRMTSFAPSGANVVRKRIDSSLGILPPERSCWAISLNKDDGPTFHYAEHDHFDTSRDILRSDYSPSIGITLKTNSGQRRSNSTEGYWDSFKFLTVTANRTHISYWMNANLISIIELPRVITDCYSSEGLWVGDAGLYIGKLNFYPTQLTPQQIREIHQGGSTLADMASGSDPADAEITPTLYSKHVFDATDYPKQFQLNAAGAAHDAREQLYLAARSPPAPHGDIRVDPTLHQDSSTGPYYTILVQGPVRLTKPDLDAGEEPRMLVDMPTFLNSGMTITMWYRHVDCSEDDSCGLFFLWAQGTGGGGNEKCRTVIWSLWLENDGFWFDNPSGTPKYQYPRNFMDQRAKWKGAHAWRHVAFSLDETADQAHLYMDGQLALTVPWGSSVAQADCPSRKIAFGHSFPGWNYGAEAEVFDMRMYVHSQVDAAGAVTSGRITSRGIFELAHQTTQQIALTDLFSNPQPGQGPKCIERTDPAHVDTKFTDHFGNDCTWYHAMNAMRPAVCSLPEVRANCRLTCPSTNECYSLSVRAKAYFVWDRIQRLEPHGVNGTVCLGRQNWFEASALAHKESVAQSCKEWAEREVLPEDLEPWAGSAWGNSQIPRVNAADCFALAGAIDEGCAFDSTPVAAFTADAMANGGDYTITFWVRPLRLPDPTASLHTDGKFHPSIHFMASLSPPIPMMGLGLWANPDGEVRMYSTCPNETSRDVYENIETFAPTSDGWTFIAITRINSTWPGLMTTKVFTNLGKFEEQSYSATCPSDASHVFSAIEVNYPMLVTPIMMVPEALPDSAVQMIFLRGAEPLKIRDGPFQPKSLDPSVASDSIPVYKLDFREKSVLMAPPLVVQERHLQSAECPFAYSTQWLREQNAIVRASICAPPNTCVDPKVMARPELTMACRGEKSKNERYFGLDLVNVGGKDVYADFLYSLTDHSFVSRSGQVRYTEWFIDSGTAKAKVIFCFFTPDAGIVSVLTVAADFSTHMPVKMQLWLQHYGMVEDAPLRVYLFVQSLCLINIVIILLTVIRKLWHLIRHDDAWPDAWVLVMYAFDFATALAALLFVALRMPANVESAGVASGVLASLSDVPWGDNGVAIETKKQTFFAVVDELLGLIDTQKFLTMMCLLILLTCLIRIIASLSCHPRLALLTQTLYFAWDDLWHSILIIFVLMAAFACIGTWRFGEEFVHFSDISQSFMTEFSMLFGDFPDDWKRSPEMRIYVVVYFLILFLLVQNFLLAIIVEAYTKVREFNESFQSEDEFFTDCWNSSLAYYKRFKYGWPRRDALALHLKELYGSRISVGFKELAEIRRPSASFRSHDAINKFLEHYGKFEFLSPPKPNLYGHKKGQRLTDAGVEEEGSAVENVSDAVDEIERRMAYLLGKPLRKVVDYKREAMSREILGIAWEDIGPKRPSSGKEISNPFLREELLQRTRFSKQELEDKKTCVPLLSSKSFIRVGDTYFKPVGKLDMPAEGAIVSTPHRSASAASKVGMYLGSSEESPQLNSGLVGAQDASKLQGILQERLLELGVTTCGVQLALKALSDATAQEAEPKAATGCWPQARVEWQDLRVDENSVLPDYTVPGFTRSEARVHERKPRDPSMDRLLAGLNEPGSSSAELTEVVLVERGPSLGRDRAEEYMSSRSRSQDRTWDDTHDPPTYEGSFRNGRSGSNERGGHERGETVFRSETTLKRSRSSKASYFKHSDPLVAGGRMPLTRGVSLAPGEALVSSSLQLQPGMLAQDVTIGSSGALRSKRTLRQTPENSQLGHVDSVRLENRNEKLLDILYYSQGSGSDANGGNAHTMRSSRHLSPSRPAAGRI